MNIFGICVVKNESDIIEHTLNAALAWCDEIFVLDNGSTDDTWNIIKAMARLNGAVVPYKSNPSRFNNAMRAQVFNHYRHRAMPGDWWCRLDADEIYVTSPRPFLELVRSCEVVWGLHLQYYFTDKDLARWEENPYLYDSKIPPEQRYRWYSANSSEARFFKHRVELKWPDGAWPRHMGRVCKERLILRHYKYRNPRQIAERLAVRQSASEGFEYIKTEDWRELIVPSTKLSLDHGNGQFHIDESKLPKHMDRPFIRMAKQIMHRTGLWP